MMSDTEAPLSHKGEMKVAGFLNQSDKQLPNADLKLGV